MLPENLAAFLTKRGYVVKVKQESGVFIIELTGGNQQALAKLLADLGEIQRYIIHYSPAKRWWQIWK